jgi:NADPH-dependent 2,4-dienoyl-CoA reductase/sulfur reductase-like enzyme
VTERLVIVGGDAGGMTAAATARRRASGDELEVFAFERGEYTSYSACGLPYYVADTIGDAQELVARTPEEHRERGIDMRMRHEVVGIDLGARTVTAHDHDGAEVVESFDQLVVATGATPIRPDLPGIDAIGVHGIQTLTDGIDLRAHIREHLHADQHAVVVGSGYVGLEMAEALKLRGLPVTIIDAAAQPMAGLDPDMGMLVADAIRSVGIALRTETMVLGFETDDGGHVRRVLTDDGVLPADLVVLGIGVRANSALAKDAGIAVGDSGGITTDARMATSVDGVWAAGDCVESYHRVSRKRVVIPLGTHANKQGRVIGVNATGGHATFGGVVGTAVTRICDVEIGRTGLSEREAKDAGLDFVTAKIESTTRAGYFPGASKITVKVVAEKSSGRLLGAQIIGREGAAKRIDVAAVAVWNEMPVDEIAQLDLAYAPPFSPIWDPVIIAAAQALKEL